jgi:hypothetical protein
LVFDGCACPIAAGDQKRVVPRRRVGERRYAQAHPVLHRDRLGPARLAADHPWNRLYTETRRRHGKPNPANAAVARKVLIATWHVLSLQQPFKPHAALSPEICPGKLAHDLAA